jgi:Spy/CpxP family protein refolding chaperone
MNLKTIALVCSLAAVAAPLSVRADNTPATPSPTTTPQPEGRRGFRFPGFESLTPEEQAKFKAAMETARKDSKVQAAREKATAAEKESREALNAAMIAADPSVEPIIKKLQEAGEKARAARAGAAQ